MDTPPLATSPERLLQGLRVVECGPSGMSAYAGRLLTGLGADVWKVEPLEGDPARSRQPLLGETRGEAGSALFLYLNAGKRSVALDLATAGGREALFTLLAAADAFICSYEPAQAEALGIDATSLHARFPRLAQVWATPFGLTGPHRDWHAENIGITCAGGWASVMAGVRPPAIDSPPHQLHGRVAEYYVGCHAAFLTLGAIFARHANGTGDVVDLSAQECIAASTNMALVVYTYDRLVAHRMAGNGSVSGILECADGFVAYIIPSNAMWDALKEIMGRPAWAMSEAFDNLIFRRDNRDLIRDLVEDWTRPLTMDEVMAAADAAHLPFAPVYTIARSVESTQIRAREFMAGLPAGEAAVRAPGAPVKLHPAAWEIDGGAPPLGEANAEIAGLQSGDPANAGPVPPLAPPRAPLAGVRVLDFTHAVAGPYTTMELAALGAEVIKVETRNRPDVLRFTPPFAGGIQGLNRSGVANQYSQGKRSWTVNLKHPEGHALVKEMVRHVDVVVENFSAGTMGRLGLGYETLSAINPRLVMVSISGYGGSGPLAGRPAFGFGPLMMSGAGMVSGMPGHLPVDEGGVAVPDPTAALHSAVAVLAALWARRTTGLGRYVETSQLETLMALMPEAILPYTMHGEAPARRGNRHDDRAPHGVFPTAGEDQWISLDVRDDGEWQRLRAVLDLPDEERFRTAVSRKQHEDALESAVAAAATRCDRFALAERLQAEGLAAVPVLDIREMAEDPHLHARGFFLMLDHPETGPMQHAGVPGRFSHAPAGIAKASPLLGEATEYVMREILGRDEAEYQRLVEAQALH